jgi:PHD-zinc-finger like domain/PHD-finger
VFCDGCDLAVHQECYGVPFIPEGQWLCRKCQLIGRNTPVSSLSHPGQNALSDAHARQTCIFCPNMEGAFKQTNTLRWSHLFCAIWIPEVSLGNHTFMEPVMEVDKVPKQRWKLVSSFREFRRPPYPFLTLCRIATFATRKWGLAFNARTRTATWRSTSPAPVDVGCSSR